MMPHHDHVKHVEDISDRSDCLDYMLNTSRNQSGPQCPADWERHTQMCWPFSSPDATVKLPCPPYDYLNPHQFVTRVCQQNATWFVNQSFDDQPYSNYHDCFNFEDRSLEEELRSWTNEKTIIILKILASHRTLHLLVHCFDLFLLLASLLLCSILFSKAKARNDKYKYILMFITSVTLIGYHIITISLQSFYDHSNIRKCQVAKSLVSFTNIFLCQCLFGYIVICMYRILNINMKRRSMIAYLSLSVVTTFVLVFFELCVEIFAHKSIHCGFGILNTTYHWTISAPKFFILACVISVSLVAVYGVYILRPPHLEKSGKLLALRVSTVCTLIMALYLGVCEVMLIFLQVVAATDQVVDSLDIYAHTYSTLAAARGLVIFTLMYLLDPYTLGMLPCACLHKFAEKLEASYIFDAEMEQQRVKSVRVKDMNKDMDNDI